MAVKLRAGGCFSNFVVDAPALRVKLTVSESNFRVMIDLVMQQKGDSE